MFKDYGKIPLLKKVLQRDEKIGIKILDKLTDPMYKVVGASLSTTYGDIDVVTAKNPNIPKVITLKNHDIKMNWGDYVKIDQALKSKLPLWIRLIEYLE